MARALDVDFSIVGGKLERYVDDVRGFLIINVNDEHLENVLNYLQEKSCFGRLWMMPTNSNTLLAAWQAVHASYLAIREDLFQAPVGNCVHGFRLHRVFPGVWLYACGGNDYHWPPWAATQCPNLPQH